MKHQLSLEELKVKSFITAIDDKQNNIGGSGELYPLVQANHNISHYGVAVTLTLTIPNFILKLQRSNG